MQTEKYTNELYHYGIKGMKWGFRKKRDEYGNRIKGNVLLAPHRAMLKPMLKSMTNDSAKMRERVNRRDDVAIAYETKKMNDKQKKIFALNYYNDRKVISKHKGDKARDQLKKINSLNKTRSEQFSIDLMGSGFLNRVGSMQIKTANTMYDHYSEKVDTLLKEMGDVKLSKIKTNKTVINGSTIYSWYGDTYVEK